MKWELLHLNALKQAEEAVFLARVSAVFWSFLSQFLHDFHAVFDACLYCVIGLLALPQLDDISISRRAGPGRAVRAQTQTGRAGPGLSFYGPGRAGPEK